MSEDIAVWRTVCFCNGIIKSLRV